MKRKVFFILFSLLAASAVAEDNASTSVLWSSTNASCVFPKDGNWKTLEIPQEKLGDLSSAQELCIEFKNSADFVNTLDRDKAFPIYFKPANTDRCGDPFPFWDAKDNDYKVLYLREKQYNGDFFHPIYCVSTEDGFHNTDMGKVLPVGGKSTAQDASIGTGSCLWDGTKYHLFYTGHNSKGMSPREAVMHTTSTDLRNWSARTVVLKGSTNGFSSDDFRDPEVFKDDNGLWHMVVATRQNGKGVLAEYTSTNLDTWSYKGIFLNCMWDRFYECPNVFKMGNYWYLVYNELHSAIRRVQYFKAPASVGAGKDGLDNLRMLTGQATSDSDTRWPDDHEGYLNGRGLYAAKTASNGTDRLLWGWSGFYDYTTSGDGCEWAGALVVSQIKQNADGTLVLVEPSSFKDNYNLEASANSVTQGTKQVFDRLGYQNRITARVKLNSGQKFGLSFANDAHTLVVEKVNSTKCMVRFYKGTTLYDRYDGYLFNYPTNGIFNITVNTDNSALTLYINDQCTYSCRIDHLARNNWKFVNYSGSSATISDVKVWQYETTPSEYNSEYVVNIRSGWDTTDSEIVLNGSSLMQKHSLSTIVDLSTINLSDKFDNSRRKNLLIQVHPEFLTSLTLDKVTLKSDNSTSINTLDAQPTFPNTTYNLLGQPVTSTYRGIIIKNGKKIME